VTPGAVVPEIRLVRGVTQQQKITGLQTTARYVIGNSPYMRNRSMRYRSISD
jgi:hypothetical protein